MPLPFKLRRTRFKCVDDEVSGRTRSEIGEPLSHVTGTTNLYSQATVPMAAFLGPRPNIRHRYDVIDTLHGASRHIGVPMSPLSSSIACSLPCPTTVRLINEIVISVYACDEPSISLLNGLTESHATILTGKPNVRQCAGGGSSLSCNHRAVAGDRGRVCRGLAPQREPEAIRVEHHRRDHPRQAQGSVKPFLRHTTSVPSLKKITEIGRLRRLALQGGEHAHGTPNGCRCSD